MSIGFVVRELRERLGRRRKVHVNAVNFTWLRLHGMPDDLPRTTFTRRAKV